MLYFLKTRYLHGPKPVYERAARKGRMLPDGLRFVDSWIVDSDALDTCYEVVETDDPATLPVWLSRWADLIAAEVEAVVKSPEAAARAGHAWDGSASEWRDETPMVSLLGGCFCGAVRYAVQGTPHHETLCHCSICRRTSGATPVAWFTVKTSEFRFTQGSARRFRSSGHGERSFCADCGTPLTFTDARYPAEVDVTTASLDTPESVPPKNHTWTSATIGWVDCGATLPRYAKSPDAPD